MSTHKHTEPADPRLPTALPPRRTARARAHGADRAGWATVREALRPTGAAPDDLAACVAAAHERCLHLHSERPVVVVPSYRGSRRQPNLTALLAMGLAREGVRVLVHGVAHDRARTTCAEVLHDLGVPACTGVEDVESLWARRAPAFVDLALLCPPLHRLLHLPEPLAVRDAARSLATLLAPLDGAPALRLIAAGAGAHDAGFDDWLAGSRASAVVLRDTLGDPVADLWHPARIDVVIDGVCRPELSASADFPPQWPLLPRAHDAATTAVYVQGVLSGEKPMPSALAWQLSVVQHTLAASAARAAPD